MSWPGWSWYPGKESVPPTDIPGKDDAEKRENYAKVMARMVEDAFPTAFLARRIRESDLPGKNDLAVFLNANPKFEIKGTRLESYLAENPDALTKVSDVEGTKNSIKALQRLYKVAPRYTQTSALLKDGFDSAYKISRMGRNSFVAKYSGALGSKAEAKRVYERAQQTQAMALNLLAEFGQMFHKTPMNVLPDQSPQTVEGVPDWSTLFGSIELCECEHCRSVLSPAAYMVDQLHFLKDRQSSLQDRSVKDLLFERRPDIGEIELTCENTNTPLPYVDLVNEVLENAVSPLPAFAPFPLNGALEDTLNSKILSDALKDAFNPHLSDGAVITVGGPGLPRPPGVSSEDHWWVIDDASATYTVRRTPPAISWMRSPAVSKLKALPPNALPTHSISTQMLMGRLREQVYPWTLPFDLWQEEARAYLGHLGVQRYQLMEAFLPGERLEILNSAGLAYEYLGIAPDEAIIINGGRTSSPGAQSPGTWNLWGFEVETLSDSNSDPDPTPDPDEPDSRITSGNWLDVIGERVDVFLQQSGLKYKELLDLLDAGFINQEMDNQERAIQIISKEGDNQDTCETKKLELSGLSGDKAVQIVRFVRLWRKLGWTMSNLDKTIRAFEPGDLDDPFIVQLSHVQRLYRSLNVPVVSLLSWWAPIDTASYTDHIANGQPQVPSLYAQLFRNRAVADPLDPTWKAFLEDPNNLSGTLSENLGAIAAALSISTADLVLLINDASIIPRNSTDVTQPDDVLSLDYLSRLYRHATLAKALKLSAADYLSALKLINADPFATTADTILFVEKINEVRSSGFSVDELSFLLRHEYTPSSGIAPSEEAIAIVLDEIRSGLQKIAAENTFVKYPGEPGVPANPQGDLEQQKLALFDGITTDPNGELTRQKLALLNWDRSIIEQVVATLNEGVTYEAQLDSLQVDLPNDTGSYEADLASLPSGFIIPPELKNSITHDATKGKLRASRILTKPERTLLLNASTELEYRNALRSIFNQQDELEGTIAYDSSRHMLRFTGAMTLVRQARLKEESTDVDYRAAIDALFDAPRIFIARYLRTFS